MRWATGRGRLLREGTCMCSAPSGIQGDKHNKLANKRTTGSELEHERREALVEGSKRTIAVVLATLSTA